MFATTGIAGWIETNLVPLILIVIAIGVLWAGNAGNVSKAVTKMGVALVGLLFLGMVLSGKADEISAWLFGLVGGA
ncbi:hypothetical protein [Xylanimonas ulmi]|uniref:TrbC/VIRB2 family protein n=1 Tax=Xylanimonas ulmi TaxID=228973 RepID=A0A4Q7M9F8_9MICO|nr:hypothetical protein [Xylanibacterium ulmi]RZS62849.1 hypothetical protein EV386_3203 [Xylanibacterium ulmi]